MGEISRPTEVGHDRWEQGVLDAPRHQKLLLEALAFDPLWLDTPLPQGRCIALNLLIVACRQRGLLKVILQHLTVS